MATGDVRDGRCGACEMRKLCRMPPPLPSIVVGRALKKGGARQIPCSGEERRGEERRGGGGEISNASGEWRGCDAAYPGIMGLKQLEATVVADYAD